MLAMEDDPVSRSQNSRKRSRVDDSPPFHLPHSADSASTLSKSCRVRDPTPPDLIGQTSAAAAAAAAAAATAAVASTPSSTPVLQPLHPPIPNFTAISQAPPPRPQNSIPHHNHSEQPHTTGVIYNIALPLPNPGRAHRFCQACDHVNHVRRKLCTNCGAPKPSAVRNAVGVRPVAENDGVHDHRQRPDDGTGAIGPGCVPHTSTNMSQSVTMGGATDIYGRNGRGMLTHDQSALAVGSAATPSGTTYNSAFRPGDATNHLAHSLSMRRPGDDIPLPPSAARPGGADGASNHHPRRLSHTVLADPLVNPSQLPAHNLPSNSFYFPQRVFNIPTDRANEHISLPSVHNNITGAGPTGLQTVHSNADANIHGRHPRADLHDGGHGGMMGGLQDGNSVSAGIGSNVMASAGVGSAGVGSVGMVSTAMGGGVGGVANHVVGMGAGGRSSAGLHVRHSAPVNIRFNDQMPRQHQGYGEQNAVDHADPHHMFVSAPGQSFFPSTSSSLRHGGAAAAGSYALPSPAQLHGRVDDGGGGTDLMGANNMPGGSVGAPTGSSGIGTANYGRGGYGLEQHGPKVGSVKVDDGVRGGRMHSVSGGMRHQQHRASVGNLEYEGRGNAGLRRSSDGEVGIGSRAEGDKSSMTGQTTVGTVEGGSHLEDGGRGPDEGRFAIGSILLPEKKGASSH